MIYIISGACGCIGIIITILLAKKEILTNLLISYICMSLIVVAELLRPGYIFLPELKLPVSIVSIALEGLAIGPILTVNLPEVVDSIE